MQIRTSHKLIGIGALALGCAGAAQAVPYDVNAEAKRIFVISSAVPPPLSDAAVQGASFLYRFVRSAATEAGDGKDALEALFANANKTVSLNWDPALWELTPRVLVAAAGASWGVWEIDGWNDTYTSINFENTTMRTGRSPSTPLAEVQFIAVYGTARRLAAGSPGGGAGVPDSGATLLMLGAGVVAAGCWRKRATTAA
ncbi:MAG: hypothetical protein IT580_01105 [Verrucomicrobiales bacterium]|nr:hypothetical protein [Verrucomicrobiales bacterium]